MDQTFVSFRWHGGWHCSKRGIPEFIYLIRGSIGASPPGSVSRFRPQSKHFFFMLHKHKNAFTICLSCRIPNRRGSFTRSRGRLRARLRNAQPREEQKIGPLLHIMRSSLVDSWFGLGIQLQYHGASAHNYTTRASLDDLVPLGRLGDDVMARQVLCTESELMCYRC